MKERNDKASAPPMTREDLAQIAAEADAHMGRIGRRIKAALKVIIASLVVILALTLYLGFIAVASVLVAVCLVTFTLYLFVRLWPGVSPAAPPRPSVLDRPSPIPTAVAEEIPRAARFRIVWSLRELSRRQDSFHISGRAAERFARTIRFILRSNPNP